MKKLTLFALLAAWLAPAIGFAQVDQPIVTYNAKGYKYQFVKSRDKTTGTFYNPAESDEAIGGWEDPDGQGAWGTLNKPKSDPCPLNIPQQINVTWPSSRDLLIRRWIDESEIGAIQNVRVNVALDNGVIIYWNGEEVGRFLHDECAEETSVGSGKPKGDTTFTIPADLLEMDGVPVGSRKHLLAVRGLWLSAKNYLDIEVIADVGFTLTTTVDGPGSLEITPEKDFYFGETVTLKATVDEPSTHFFGRWEQVGDDVNILPGWDGIPLTPEDDPFANPIEFTVDQNISVTAYFSVLPPPQDPIQVSSNEDYIPNPEEEPTPGTLRWAIEEAENYPGPDEIVINVGGTIQLFEPLSASDVVIINQSGGLVTLEPAPGFGSESSGLGLPGVFVNWGYESGGITLSGLQIQKFPGAGICIQSDNNTVEGCIITDNRGHGICIIDGNNNTIGGTADGKGNTIFLNDGSGVAVSEESTEDLVPPPSGNGILGNSIYHNGGLGIDLANRIGEFGVSWNRFPDLTPYDRSDYINDAQNFPDLYLASIAGADPANPNSSVVFGSLFGPTGKTYRIEMFRNSTPDENDNIADPLGNGEGEELVGWTETPVSVTEEEDGLGNLTGNAIYNFEIVTTQPLAGGDILSATATDEANNTSEFSSIIYTGVITRIYGAMVAENDPHNRWVVNTTFLGIPLHWPDGIAEFSIGLNFPDHFKPQVNDVLSAWNAVQSVPLSFSLAQNLSPTDQWALTPDGKNNLVYAADEAEFVSKVGPGLENVLGITRVRYNSFTGEIFDADVLFNGGFNYQDNTSPSFPSDDPKRIDFKAVGVHELGHAGGGLSDIYNRNDAYYQLFMGVNPVVDDVTMYGIIEPDDTYQRSVHADDQEGLAYIYGNVLPAHVDLALIIDASQSFADPATYDAFDPSIDAAVELVDKLRVGDRVGIIQLSGETPFVPVGLGFQEILPDPTPGDAIDDVQVLKDEIKAAIAGLTAATTDDRRAIGSALSTAASQFPTSDVGRRAIVLFSAGNETEAPSALDPGVLQQLTGADPITVYTMGFAQSPDGANLGSKLADATGGAFYETDITTLSPVANQIWDNLTGYQLILSRQAISWQGNKAISWQGSQNWNSAISWQGAKNLAISWQGNRAISWQGSVDKGTAAMFPAISWQGKAETATLAKISGVEENVVAPKFHLALITPDFEALNPPYTFYTYPWEVPLANDPAGTITPDNWESFPGVEYITDETYAFYRITPEYQGTLEGDWILVPIGANGEDAPYPAEPVTVNGDIATFTDVVMDVLFDKSNYLPNEHVRITVSLFEGGQVQGAHTIGGGPILDATVSAEVTLPTSPPTETVSFVHQGNGIYSGEFTNTGAKGTYDFVVTAEGTAPLSGEEFFRRLDQSVYVAPVYASAVLFAENSVTLQEGAQIITGDVLVNEPAGQGVSVLVGLGASTPAGYNIKADRIQVLEGATVASTIYTNEDPINAGTITGTVNIPLDLPVGTFPPFDPADEGVGSANNLSVNTNDNAELTSPDILGDVNLEPHSSLTLVPGEYDFRSLRMKSDSKLYFTGPTKLRIRYGIHADNGSYFGSAPGGSVAPTDIIVHVEGTDVESASSYSVNFSPKSTILATLYAPNGTILLNQESRADGAFFGEDIVIGQYVNLRLASGFGALAKSIASGEPSVSSAEESVPKTYILSQNYPNPFNPSTQIRYGLPRASHVNLIVYNMLGQEVVRLVDDVQPEGYHVVQWNGTNDFGNTVSSGMYIFRLTAGDFVQTKKMMLLK